MLTLQNRVSLNNLTIRSLRAGTLTARAWETLRAAGQGAALVRDAAARPELVAWVDQDLPRMRRGDERC